MPDPRLTEQRNPRSREIDRLSPLEIADLINAEDRMVAQAVGEEREAIARAMELTVQAFRAGGRLIYVGAGTSGRLGVLDAAEMPPTYGTDPDMVQGVIAGGPAALVRAQERAEDRTEDGAAAIEEKRVGPRDFVLGIATSGTTPYVHGALHRAREHGARTGFPAVYVSESGVALGARRRDSSPGGTRGDHRLHPHEGRDRNQDRSQHHHHRRDGADG